MAGVLIAAFLAIAILAQSLSLQPGSRHFAERKPAPAVQGQMQIRAEPEANTFDTSAWLLGEAQIDPWRAPPEPAGEVGSGAPDVRTIAVKPGDTLTRLVIAAGADPSEARNAVATLATVFDAAKLREGQLVTLTFGALPPGAKPSAPEPEPLDAAGGSAVASSDAAPIYAPLVAVALKAGAGREIVVRRTAEGSFAAEIAP